MIPLVLLPFLTEILKLINNIIEGKSIDQRKAESLIAYNLVWPMLKDLLPTDAQKLVEDTMKGIQ